MRRYSFVRTDGSTVTFDAEQDSLHPGGAIVLSKQVELITEGLARTDKKIEIVRVISLHNVFDYGYVDLDA